MKMCLLDASFYDRHPKLVAKELLGKTILRKEDTEVIKAVIIDTEAYGPINEDVVAAGQRGPRALRNWEPGLAWTTYYMWGMPTFTHKAITSTLGWGIGGRADHGEVFKRV